MTEKALAQDPTLETGPSGPSWGKKEQMVSVEAPLVPKIVVSHNFGILSLGAILSHMSRMLIMVHIIGPT